MWVKNQRRHEEMKTDKTKVWVVQTRAQKNSLCTVEQPIGVTTNHFGGSKMMMSSLLKSKGDDQ
jgi:hypothetical protein